MTRSDLPQSMSGVCSEQWCLIEEEEEERGRKRKMYGFRFVLKSLWMSGSGKEKLN